MSNLTKHTTEIQKVRDHTDELKEVLFDAVALGYKIAQAKSIQNLHEEIQITTEIVSKHIITEYGYLTLSEVRKSIIEGFYGKWGEYYGVTPKSIVFFLKRYSESRERKDYIQALKEANKPKELPQPKSFTIEQKREAWDQAKAEYQKTGRLLGELLLFGYGVDIGEIDLEDETFIEEVKFKAQKWFKSELKNLKLNGGMAKSVMIKNIQNVLKLDHEGRKNSDLWQNRCKYIAVELTLKQNI